MAVHTQEPPRKPKAYRPVSETRKVRKPLMERKRRERINSSLEQLALLLKEAKLVAADKPVAKLEKADILELTVRHLKSVRRVNFTSDGTVERKVKKEAENLSNDRNLSMHENAKHITDENSDLPNDAHVHAKAPADEICGSEELQEVLGERASDSNYLKGFHKCLSEVRQATESAQEFCALKERLFDHLDSCLHNLTSDTPSKEKVGNGKRVLSQGNDCEIKAKKKRKRCDTESPLPSNATVAEVPSELTLVPMQLTDGRVAFLVHGDGKILIHNKANTVGKVVAPFGGNPVHSNDLSGLPKKFPKLLPASDLHKIPNYKKPTSSFDCKPYIATPGSVLDGASINATEKIPHTLSEEVTLHATDTTKVTNLLKLYPNIKTVSLPVGTSVPSLQSNFSSTHHSNKKLNHSIEVATSSENSPTPDTKPRESFPAPSILFSESYSTQTPLLSHTTSQVQCGTSQASVRKCIVYPGAHLLSSGASFSAAVTPQAVPTTAPPTSVPAGQQVVVPTSQSTNRSFQTSTPMLLSDSRGPLNPNRSIVNLDQIPGPSAVSFPPTPPPSIDQYASELSGDGNQLYAIPPSLSSTLPTSALKAAPQPCDLASHSAIISGMYSYLQHCNPTPQTFVRPTVSMSSARDDEEFIDVENIPREDLQQPSVSFAGNENIKYNNDDKGDMWRPW